jgi:hypothetical protein
MWIIHKTEIHAIGENTIPARIQDNHTYKKTTPRNLEFPRKYLYRTCLALCTILGHSILLPLAHFSDNELEKIVVYLGKYNNILFKLGFD